MAAPDFKADTDPDFPDVGEDRDAWIPFPAGLSRRLSDGALGLWDGGAWVLVSSLGGGGGGAVSSVFTRTGDVVADAADYAAHYATTAALAAVMLPVGAVVGGAPPSYGTWEPAADYMMGLGFGDWFRRTA